ncbi:zinc ribbon domain-containing protein [Brasilonema sennae]
MFECSRCGFVIDRDLNAAINLSHCSTRVSRLEACGVSRLAKT